MGATTSGTCRYVERQVACPRCLSPVGVRCVTKNHTPREKPHARRFELATMRPELREAWLRGEDIV